MKLRIDRADGGMSIATLMNGSEAEAVFDKWEACADTEWLPATWSMVDDSAVPADRTFRDAWTAAGGDGINVDMPKARDLHKRRIRAARRPLLEALDVEYQRADERGDVGGKTDVAARKQALRDAPSDPAIAAAKTPEELAAVWPVALGSRGISAQD
jgi:hypothetical protein